MTATVKTVTTAVTKRKLLRKTVNPKALMWKVTVSPTTNTSFEIKSSEPCHHCQNWNVFAPAVVKRPSYFWTITIVFVPFVLTKFPVDAEHLK